MARARRQVAFSAKSKRRNLPPRKTRSNRDREYLRPEEVDALMKAARRLGRHGDRDATLVLLMFRHGLRTAELVALKWSQVDLKRGYLDVKRAKGGNDSKHPLRDPQLRSLRQLQRDYPKSPYIFVSERGTPLSTRSVRHIIARAGEEAGLDFAVHPHQLRHACGYFLASKGHDTRAIQDYLGHKDIHHTVRYTRMAPQRFESFWDD